MEQGGGGFPRGQVRCEDRPGSSGTIHLPTPETGSLFKPLHQHLHLHELLAGARALGMLSFRLDPGFGCAPMGPPCAGTADVLAPCPASRSCTRQASISPAIDRIHRLRPCASRRFPVSGIASPGESPTPLNPRNAFLPSSPKNRSYSFSRMFKVLEFLIGQRHNALGSAWFSCVASGEGGRKRIARLKRLALTRLLS
jgi:hypothetical protein